MHIEFKKTECYSVLETYGATHQRDSKGLFPRDRGHQIQGQTKEAAATSIEVVTCLVTWLCSYFDMIFS